MDGRLFLGQVTNDENVWRITSLGAVVLVEALMQRGLSRHEAIHQVGSVLSAEMFHVPKDDRPFDEPGYIRKLRRLIR